MEMGKDGAGRGNSRGGEDGIIGVRGREGDRWAK